MNTARLEELKALLSESSFPEMISTGDEIAQELQQWLNALPTEEEEVAEEESEAATEATENAESASTEEDDAATEETPVAEADAEQPPVEMPDEALVNDVRQVVATYRAGKHEYFEAKRAEEQKNLEEKEAILKELDRLIREEENIGRAYQYINDLHEKWNGIGDVPRNNYAELQTRYSKLNEQFYYNIGIYKELRDNDFKRNLQQKQEVIAQLDELLKLDSIGECEAGIKKLQAEWENIGPTRQEEWEELREQYWSKVKSIYGKIRMFYDSRREEQSENLEKKKALLEKTRDAVAELPDNHKGWEAQTKVLLGLQSEWKAIGFAGKGESEEVWKQFRALCDTFFNAKKEFYGSRNEEFDQHKAKKEALVAKANELKESDNWIDASKALIRLQKDWKRIGNAGPRHEHKLWKQFREACDYFFDRRKAFDAEQEKALEANVELKQAVIAKIEGLELPGEAQAALKVLKEVTAEYNAIGQVPSAKKNEVYNAFKSALDKHYSSLDMDKEALQRSLFEAKIEQMKSSPDADRLISKERGKLRSRINELQDEIKQFENNLGFFANSKGAEKIIQDVNKKIEKNRSAIDDLKSQLKLMNN